MKLMLALSLSVVCACAQSPRPCPAPAPAEVKVIAESKAVPAVKMRYAIVFDEVCWGPEPPAAAVTWIKEMYSQMPAFQGDWDRDGVPLLEATIAHMGKGFEQREMRASLFLCAPFPSLGTPLLIKAGWFLSSPMNGKPLPRHLFVSNVFHELLHTYLEDNFRAQLINSKIALSYATKGEPRTAILHLHLAALMSTIYTKLGRTEQLQEVIAFEGRFAPAYKRAWEIVAEGGPKALLAELHAAP